ncbi:protein of unknown function (DUF928) [Synechococcus sp. PCC 7502]|uniref:DUF928 domain-containing protein n=1 Tax=Synechococcus sp. PCC 7502 TaxID=1173263 RepID=UPI00029FC6E0|nr:DUF928 domain-containing protein [Synechococcus sp. PCC 7502]AFY74924.1 protein of unknown function (DUF928) [Synechococcus sp. PCC 7502]
MNMIWIKVGLGVLSIVSISGIGIGVIISGAIANPWTSQVQIIAQKLNQAMYGLGLPKTAGTGGSVRLKDDPAGFESSGGKFLPILALMVPEDGARTASDRPTVYWNMILPESQDYKLTFFLQETAAADSKIILEQEITITKGGLFKFQVPQSLSGNSNHRWGVKCKWLSGQEVTANGILAYTVLPPQIKIALDAAKNNLERARIYASNGYWYDALDAYTSWITANPQDTVAIQERGNVINEAFKDRKGLDSKTFIAQVNASPIQEFK